MMPPDASQRFDSPSPIYAAQHSERYERRRLIEDYEERYDCRLVVLIDVLFHRSVPLFEELVYDASPEQDLHVLLASPGGDGETAIRLIRSMQARSREVTVIVPDPAKSAAALIALGAHHVFMGPTSDLGPIDPQFMEGDEENPRPVSGKDVIAAVERASKAIQEAPETYPLHVALLSDVTAIQVEQAYSALERSEDLLEAALRANPSRTPTQVMALKRKLKKPLIQGARSHSAFFGIEEAKRFGLPVIEATDRPEQWQAAWRLFGKYLIQLTGGTSSYFYEGRRASQIS